MNDRVKRVKIDPKTTKEQYSVRDRPVKSIFKAITWRLIASGTTFTLAYLFYREDPKALEKATSLTAVEMVLKIVLYFLHERAWASVRWGRMRVYVLRKVFRIKRKKRPIIKKSDDSNRI